MIMLLSFANLVTIMVTKYEIAILEFMKVKYPELDPADYPSVSFQDKWICCSKPSCSVCNGKFYEHGQYKYGYYRDPKTKQMKGIYLGKVDEPEEKSFLGKLISHLM